MLKIMKPGTGQQASLSIPFFKTYLNDDAYAMANFLDSLPRQQLKASNWSILKNEPMASFSIAYDTNSIFLKYYVCESDFSAKYTNTHDPVSEDSCVEFFIGFGEDDCYYNLEFNALGTCLAAYGKNRYNRQRLPVDVVREIKHELNWLTYLPGESRYEWTLTLSIPFTIFYHSDVANIIGKQARANAYKCGEKLIEPHHLMWNAIQTYEPDFHQPYFFRKILFQEEL